MNVLPIPMEEPIPIPDRLIRETTKKNVSKSALHAPQQRERSPNSDGEIQSKSQ